MKHLVVVREVAVSSWFCGWISSGLMIRTFRALRQVHPGFTDPEAVQLLTVSIHEAQVKEPERVLRMQQDMLEKIEAIPGVTSVAMANAVPMDGDGWSDVIFAEGHAYSENQLPAIRRFRFVSPGYFKTMGYRLVAGRDFTWNEVYNRNPVAAVSESTARELWHDPGSALGKRIRENKENSWREVIGVVGDVRDDGLNKKTATMIYWPTLMKGFEDGKGEFIRRTLTFVVRSNRTGSESLLKEVRQAVWAVNPNVPVADVRTMGEIYTKSLARTSLTLVMLGIAGAMALLLGADWHLRRHFVLGIAANEGDRYPDGGRRKAAGTDADVCPAWIGAGGHWRRVRAGGGIWPDAPDDFALVRGKSLGSAHLCGGFSSLGRGSGSGKLPTGTPRFGRGSG